ncbi:MAG: PEP-CTERM sorting domain-containing protein [Verrucomicrobiota bacterium]
MHRLSILILAIAALLTSAHANGGATLVGNYTSPGGNASLFDPDDFSTLGGGAPTSFDNGFLTFNTTTGRVEFNPMPYGSPTFSGYGSIVTPQSSPQSVALFNFESLNIGENVSINVVGYNPLVISSRTNLRLASNIDITPGMVGGGNLNMAPGFGHPGIQKGVPNGGAGAGHASMGEYGTGFNSGLPFTPTPRPGGSAYNYPSLNAGLFGGSTGGAEPSSVLPGEGGGAIGLIAQDTLTLAANIAVPGGAGQNGFDLFNPSSGGGSAGSVLLAAPDIDLTSTPTIDVQGGYGGSFSGATINSTGNFASFGGKGSDGRVAYIHDTMTVFGNANILGVGGGGNGTLFNGVGNLPQTLIVPEPSRALLLLGGFALALLRRRRAH